MYQKIRRTKKTTLKGIYYIYACLDTSFKAIWCWYGVGF